MIARRDFLRAAAGAVGAALLPACRQSGEAVAQGWCAGAPAGVQLYTLREALARDPRAALGAVAELGIGEVELFGLGRGSEQLFGLPLAELKDVLDRLGLPAPLAHVSDEFGDAESVAAIAERARVLGVGTVVIALPSELVATRDGRSQMAGPTSVAQLDGIAARLERAGRAFREHGLGFAYHNHHVEFMAPPDAPSLVPLDYLLERVDPAAMALELDVGWAAAAEQDAVAYLDRYRGRVVACHLKDFRDGAGAEGADAAELQARLVEPGAGGVDFAAVLSAMRAGGVPHGFIEIDATPDPQGAVERGRRHLQSLRC